MCARAHHGIGTTASGAKTLEPSQKQSSGVMTTQGMSWASNDSKLCSPAALGNSARWHRSSNRHLAVPTFTSMVWIFRSNSMWSRRASRVKRLESETWRKRWKSSAALETNKGWHLNRNLRSLPGGWIQLSPWIHYQVDHQEENLWRTVSSQKDVNRGNGNKGQPRTLVHTGGKCYRCKRALVACMLNEEPWPGNPILMIADCFLKVN